MEAHGELSVPASAGAAGGRDLLGRAFVFHHLHSDRRTWRPGQGLAPRLRAASPAGSGPPHGSRTALRRGPACRVWESSPCCPDPTGRSRRRTPGAAWERPNSAGRGTGHNELPPGPRWSSTPLCSTRDVPAPRPAADGCRPVHDRRVLLPDGCARGRRSSRTGVGAGRAGRSAAGTASARSCSRNVTSRVLSTATGRGRAALKVLGGVPFDAVPGSLPPAPPVPSWVTTADSNDEAETHIRSAQLALAAGRWHQVLLEGPEVSAWYCPGIWVRAASVELIPRTGLTVAGGRLPARRHWVDRTPSPTRSAPASSPVRSRAAAALVIPQHRGRWEGRDYEGLHVRGGWSIWTGCTGCWPGSGQVGWRPGRW